MPARAWARVEPALRRALAAAGADVNAVLASLAPIVASVERSGVSVDEDIALCLLCCEVDRVARERAHQRAHQTRPLPPYAAFELDELARLSSASAAPR